MYKMILTHEVLPGKLTAMKEWFKADDDARAKQNPAYKPPKRHITVFGSVHQVVIEAEMEKCSEQPFVYAEAGQREVLEFIVPGRTELRVLKEI